MYLFIMLPAITPRKDAITRAIEEPIKVYQIDSDLEANNIVESCVLSPSSARNTTQKAETIAFHIQTTYYKSIVYIVYSLANLLRTY